MVKQMIKLDHDASVWRDCFACSNAGVRPYLGTYVKEYQRWDYNKSCAVLFWRCGSLRLRNMWKVYNKKKGVSTKCIVPMCGIT